MLGVSSTKPFDLKLWNVSEFFIDGFEGNEHDAISLLRAHLYYRTLKNLPFLARLWFTHCSNRKLVIAVESYTEKYFSPFLITTESKIVQDSEIEGLRTKINQNGQEIIACFEFEEAELDIVIKLPSCYPLKLVEVTSGTAGGRQAGISEARWRAWLLGVSSVMVGLNGTVADALNLFKKNVTLHFEGIEECAICYAVISPVDRSTPQKQCKTCKNVFHGSCLFKVIIN